MSLYPTRTIIIGQIDGLSLVVNQEVRTEAPVVDEQQLTNGEPTQDFDVNTALGRNGTEFNVWNDGAGDITVATSSDGSTFGTGKTVKAGEPYSITAIDIDTLRLTKTSGTTADYRAVAI